MKFSLRKKTITLIVLMAAVLGCTSLYVSSRFANQIIDEGFKNKALDMAKTTAAVLDAKKAASVKEAILTIYNNTEDKVTSDAWGSPEFEEYSAKFAPVEQSEDFQYLLAQLQNIQDVNDVDCLYVSFLDRDNEYFLYMVDAANEDACPPGCIDPLYEENRELLENPERGFPPYITNTEPYGWLVTAGVPFHDAKGELIAYAMTDISMDTLRRQQHNFTIMLAILLVILTVIICAAAILAVDYFIVNPINRLSVAVNHYSADSMTQDDNEINSLKIHSHDEIGTLYDSFRKMAWDIKGYIENLMATTQELKRTQLQADEMDRLARKDALTGVGSKLAYDNEVEILTEEMKAGTASYGIVMVDMNHLKWLNDTFGHEKGNEGIKKICSILCDTFKRSPVFRIGGDEFVVIIKGYDYDNVDKLLKEFNHKLQTTKGEPWERVTAASGYALYTNEASVEEVFHKADQVMYECKKEMEQHEDRS